MSAECGLRCSGLEQLISCSKSETIGAQNNSFVSGRCAAQIDVPRAFVAGR